MIESFGFWVQGLGFGVEGRNRSHLSFEAKAASRISVPVAACPAFRRQFSTIFSQVEFPRYGRGVNFPRYLPPAKAIFHDTCLLRPSQGFLPHKKHSPTIALCLGAYDPRGVGVSYEQGTPAPRNALLRAIQMSISLDIWRNVGNSRQKLTTTG